MNAGNIKRNQQELSNTEGLAQVSLGNTLSEARASKGWTRLHLSKLSGINPSSIAKYEQAGNIDEDGRYPNSQKLAILCFHLGIAPSKVLWASLPNDEYWDVAINEGPDVRDHPHFAFIEGQYESLIKENRFLREASKMLLGIEVREFPYDNEDAKWVRSELRSVISRQEDFESRMLQWGALDVTGVRIHYSTPDHSEAWVHDSRKSGKITQKEDLPRYILAHSSWEHLKETTETLEKFLPELMKTDPLANKKNKKNPEDALPAPPSPKSTPTEQRKEGDDG